MGKGIEESTGSVQAQLQIRSAASVPARGVPRG